MKLISLKLRLRCWNTFWVHCICKEILTYNLGGLLILFYTIRYGEIWPERALNAHRWPPVKAAPFQHLLRFHYDIDWNHWFHYYKNTIHSCNSKFEQQKIFLCNHRSFGVNPECMRCYNQAYIIMDTGNFKKCQRSGTDTDEERSAHRLVPLRSLPWGHMPSDM